MAFWIVLVIVFKSVRMSVSPAARAVPGKRHRESTKRRTRRRLCWNFRANSAKYLRCLLILLLLSRPVLRVLPEAARNQQDRAGIFPPIRNTSRSAACSDVAVTTTHDRGARGHRSWRSSSRLVSETCGWYAWFPPFHRLRSTHRRFCL